MSNSINKSNIIAAIALALASVQSFKIGFNEDGFKFELTKTALAQAEARVDELEQQSFGLASLCEE